MVLQIRRLFLLFVRVKFSKLITFHDLAQQLIQSNQVQRYITRAYQAKQKYKQQQTQEKN